MDIFQSSRDRGRMWAGICLLIVAWLTILAGSYITVNQYLSTFLYTDRAVEELRHMKSEIDRLKDDTRRLNEAVVGASLHLNRLIERSAEVNGEIGKLMEYSLAQPGMRDSIEMLYQEQLGYLEPGIDSVNQVFEETSALMLEKLIVLGDKEKNQRILQAGVRHNEHRQAFLRIFFLVLVVTGVSFMTWGIVLLGKSIKRS